MIKNISTQTQIYSLDNILYFSPFFDSDICYCCEMPVSANEFFSCGMLDIRPEVSLIVDSESDKTDCNVIRYNGQTYVIYRRYIMSTGYTQLYCSKKVGVM